MAFLKNILLGLLIAAGASQADLSSESSLGGRHIHEDGDSLDSLRNAPGGNSGNRATWSQTRGKVEVPKASDIVIKGQSCSADDILKVMRWRAAGLHHIYYKFLDKNPGLEGKIVLKISIGADGTVSKVTVKSSTTRNPDFDKEIKDSVNTWPFSKVNAKDVTVTIPIVFLLGPF